jgi:hypothetical protein
LALTPLPYNGFPHYCLIIRIRPIADNIPLITAEGKNAPIRPARKYPNSICIIPAKVTDISAGLVVFLVALPLCLGIALASGAPLFSGLIAGIIGGLVVSLCSGSQLSVSGPAAGLTVIIIEYF